MRSFSIALTLVFAIGCGGDDGGGTNPDAATNLPACTGVAYDACTDTTGSTDCNTGLTCRLFGTQGYTICTPTCDANNPCPPDKNGAAVECNMMGRCRAEPNACTP